MIELNPVNSVRDVNYWGFWNWFNPAMSDKTLIKPRELSLRGAQRRSNLHCDIATLTLAMTKVILWFKIGKGVLPTSCRFNNDLKINRLEDCRFNNFESCNLSIEMVLCTEQNLAKSKLIWRIK